MTRDGFPMERCAWVIHLDRFGGARRRQPFKTSAEAIEYLNGWDPIERDFAVSLVIQYGRTIAIRNWANPPPPTIFVNSR